MSARSKPSADDLARLIEVMEKAEAPQRALDAAIGRALAQPHRVSIRKRRGEEVSRYNRWPRYTASSDAALALLERRFAAAEAAIYTNWPLRRYVPQNKDGSWSFPRGSRLGCWVRFYGGEYLGPLYNAEAEGNTVALAICTALLKAELVRAVPNSISPRDALNLLAARGHGDPASPHRSDETGPGSSPDPNVERVRP